ncbi:uncharacterized protein zgc:174935 [Chanos chanos]|uniref:Uncharacterized protein zgc:174935 n=1 Tax=Chanos chanos TaxID=29144 RepID=A0A6J2W8Q5_CHACN|nr:uncharacterized protein LOC115820798 [Chanos chanos]
MKYPMLLLALVILASLGLAAYIQSRRKLEMQLAKQASFQDIKYRVTRDVLGEYHDQVVRTNSLADKTKAQVEELNAQVAEVQEKADKKKEEMDACNGEKKRITDEMAASETEKTNAQKEFEKEKARWTEEMAKLKQEKEQRSKVCDYIKKDSSEGRTLCGDPPVQAEKPEEKKAESKKEEQPKR